MKPLCLALATLAVAGCAVTDIGDVEPPVPPDVPPVDGSACARNIDPVGPMRTKITCEAYCQPDTAPRSSFMRITWTDDARGRPGDSRIDVTVYKTGFDELAYASYCDEPVQKQAVADSLQPVIHLPELEDELAFRLAVVERQEARRRGEANTLVLRDLQPGIAYFWRAAQRTAHGWLTSAATYCMAAVCPVDFVDESQRVQPKSDSPEQQDDR